MTPNPAPRIDWYLSLNSIWSHIGYEAIQQMRRDLGATFNHKLIPQWRLFEATGGTPLRLRHVARQRWRDFEIQRWCAKRGVKLDPSSKFMLADKTLGECVGIAALRAGLDIEQYLRLALRAIWSEAQDIADPVVVERIAEAAGLPARELLGRAGSPEVVAIHDRNLREAIEANVFGTPTFVWNGEVFWGQDHLEALAEAVRSGRPPYRPFV